MTNKKDIDMYAFTNDELRSTSPEELNSLKEKAKKGDNIAKYKIAMCVLYAQDEKNKDYDIHQYLNPSETSNDEMAFLLLGYSFEHAIGTSKNYAKAVECYSRAYDLLNKIRPSTKGTIRSGSNAFKEMEKQYDNLVKLITKVITVKNFCQFKEGNFIFPWDSTTRNSLIKLLPQLSNDVAEFGELFAKTITNLKDEEQGEWEFRYQDTLLMPLEIMKTLAARDSLEQYLVENGHQVFPADPYFNNALGRCLIDDDDAYDNDYIIGGLLNMAGHEENPLWQYRAGLWYEYCDNNLEPQTAEYWYEQAKKELPAAKTALERLQNSLNYRILVNAKEGTAKDCQTLMKRSSKNPQNSIGWIIESALRGDESAIQRLENNPFSPKGQSSILGALSSADDNQLYYTLLKKEIFADQKALHQWENTVVAEKEAYRKRLEEEARRKAEAERRRLEAERKAKEEAIRKAKEAEEAKRRAEEAKRRAEEEAKRRAEEAKRRAEEEAIRKAKEAEEAKRRREAEEKRRQAEEAERKRKEEERRKKEAVAWNVLQSCSKEDIENYGISIISFAAGKKPTIYYRGYTFVCQEEITKIKSYLDVKSISNLIAERGGKGIFEVKDYIRKDFETYYKENSKTLANAENIITFCSESDLLKLWRFKGHYGGRRIVREAHLLALCFDPNIDSIYSFEYQNFFCDIELGGGVCEILQAGFLGGHRDDLKEMDLDIDCEPITKQLSSFEGFTHLVLGAIAQYKILNKSYEEDTVLFNVLAFDVNAEVWVNGRYRDCLHLLESNTTIPCKNSKTIVDDECSSIILSLLGKRFALDVPKLFGHFPKSFEITCDVDANGIIKITLKDKESKKEVSIRDEQLFNYEESELQESIRHAREAEEAKRRAEEAKRRAEAEAIRKAKEAEEAKRRAEEEEKRRAEEARVINKLVNDMVLIEGGRFMMGSALDQDSNVKDEQLSHWVKLSPYRICRYEVTLEQWATLMKSYPTRHRDPKRPVANISWDDCQEFIKKLNERTEMNFRLPTEAEWEFAARGGNKSKGFKYAGSNNLDEIAWIWKNSGDALLDEYDKDTVKNNNCRTHDVGQKAPNELGLYDMCGNVWEWCADWYGNYSGSEQENPKGPSSGTERVQRGGCYSTKNPARVAYRLSGVINEKYANLGFRLASEPTAEDFKLLKEREAKRKAAIKSHNGHDYIDLGLPSGTLWATCNIGASKPEEYGDYLAWGETHDSGKHALAFPDYKFARKKKILFIEKWSLTKYCDDKKIGNVDNKRSLDKEDDAAYVRWGNGWLLPTKNQFEELIDDKYTSKDIVLLNGVKGVQITSKMNGNTLFFPACGKHTGGINEEGYYWTRERSNKTTINFHNDADGDILENYSYESFAYRFICEESELSSEMNTWNSVDGLSIRPVRSK